jgi:hypothetical protein
LPKQKLDLPLNILIKLFEQSSSAVDLLKLDIAVNSTRASSYRCF